MGGPWAIKRWLHLALVEKSWKDAWGGSCMARGVVARKPCGYGEDSKGRGLPKHLEKMACTYSVATPELHDPRGFLTDCSGDRRRNHGTRGLKWLVLPGSCFSGMTAQCGRRP